LAPGDEAREAAWDDLEDLARFGRQMGEQLVEVARAELSKQLESVGVGSLEELFDRLADLVRSQPVDVPSQRAGSSPDAGPPLHLEPVVGAGGTVDTQPDQSEKVAKSNPPKAKADTINAGKKDAKGAKSHRRADRLHKVKPEKHTKAEKPNKKAKKTEGQKTEKDPGSPPAGGPNRVLTLTRAPDSAGRV
jgi:hypothetical protein